MVPEIWEAVIAAVGAFITALIVASRDEIRSLLARGQRHWSGLWEGTGYSRPTQTEYKITTRLRQRGRVVTGTLTAQGPETVEYEIKGRIRGQEFMTYYAKNAAKNTVNYLVGMNRLDRNGKKMTGEYVARSRLVDQIASGRIELDLVER